MVNQILNDASEEVTKDGTTEEVEESPVDDQGTSDDQSATSDDQKTTEDETSEVVEGASEDAEINK